MSSKKGTPTGLRTLATGEVCLMLWLSLPCLVITVGFFSKTADRKGDKKKKKSTGQAGNGPVCCTGCNDGDGLHFEGP